MSVSEKKTNFNEELIPDCKDIIDYISRVFNNKLEKFKFFNLFDLKKGGYSERRQWIVDNLGYNCKKNDKDSSNNSIKGLYIFYESEEPVYIGISKNIMRRIKQHLLGNSHYEASLFYLIAREEYDKTIGDYQGERNDFPLEDYSYIQENMRNNWFISIIPESDNYTLHFMEIYLACQLKTKWNTFETH